MLRCAYVHFRYFKASVFLVEPRDGNLCGSCFWREDAGDYGQKPALRGEELGFESRDGIADVAEPGGQPPMLLSSLLRRCQHGG